ncbi:HAMP domain-containing histidine kinase [Streptococcus mutans]|uniref:sensor histidine kinase n=1 Tax=Streptococcus mutans TaxID=1309 RepID=UPI00046533C0|nr:HAMP domain-containing sensor histidine kinase [Streptococcus mutans]AYO48022.1 sensor histidine kinase [Streptococcus mutans]MCB4942737.1 HAMP domain-containing histidine kinase [Streptococcus mutans]MCB5045292.1 HAMP domain-containing histidine kinase [Streptococcus mutans]MCB5084021.1 HAMP domain-containing histidine kinase [Streptococcus mutans]MCB5084982.1 HAMP domain-containing histidine kinase [Streptococcus mutans]
MAMKKSSCSLKMIFTLYFATVSLAFIASLCLFWLAFVVSLNTNLIIPANQTEQKLQRLDKEIKQTGRFKANRLPKDTTYLLLTKDGKIKESTMTKKLQQQVLASYSKKSVNPSDYGYFMVFKPKNEIAIVNYQLKAHYSIAWMNRYLPNVSLLFLILTGLGTLLVFSLVTILFARRLQRQLSPIIAATQKIAKQNLDFTVQSSDIKEFNQVLNSLDTMRAVLRDSLMHSWQVEQEKQNQIAALTHDIKTPLTVIKGNTELLKQTELSETQEAFVGYSLKNIGQVETYLQQLSYLAKNSQLQDFHPEKIKVAAFLEELSQNSQALAATKDIKIQFVNNLSDAQLTAYWDKGLLARALMNIISNAVEHSPQGSQLQLVCHLENELFQLTCLDSGQGFSIEALDKAKMQFFQDDTSRHDRKHSGLGLTIADNIIHLHGGSLSLSNDAKTASGRVDVVLPLAKM